MSGKEKVVDRCQQCHRKGKHATAVLVDQFFHGDQQQRKKRGYVLKVVEENVEQLEAGKGIQQAADHGSVRTAYKSPDIGICRQRGDAVFHAQQHRHGKCYPAAGENGGQPEKGTAQQIKGIGTDEVDTEVGVPVPAEAAAANGIICQIVKGDLLRIVVAIVDVIAAVCDDDRQDHHQQAAEAQQECQQIPTEFLPQSRAAKCH